jgi:hypothetical protein
METFGVNFGGESRIVMQDLPKKSSVEWPAQQHAAMSPEIHHTHHTPASSGASGGGSFPAGRERGLRVRIK